MRTELDYCGYCKKQVPKDHPLNGGCQRMEGAASMNYSDAKIWTPGPTEEKDASNFDMQNPRLDHIEGSL